MLRGRHAECEVLDGLLGAVRAGRSAALVVRGEAGVGKTALLEYVVERASDCRLARAAGVQSEMELAFAGLHQLCAPLLDRLPGLPDPQRDALATVFGLSAGHPPDRFLVGLAVLSLFSEAAADRPLVCLVDDAQWLDRESVQVLAFVARRLHAESVAVVFAVRGPGAEQELAGVAELAVTGLGDADARALLDSVITGPLDARVRDRIVADTYGNPLALLELPRGLTAAELAGGFGLPDARALPEQIEDSFRRRLEGLPAESRRLLLVAAAEPLGDPLLVGRAAAELGIGPEAAAPAARAGLLELRERVRFRHPLMRSAAYLSASADERRSAHRALAEVTDPEIDPDRRAWHRAHAATGLDEDVAQDLERSAGRAQARGGLAAAAAFLERAATLTPEPSRRAERALDAAEASHRGGALERAVALVAMAQAGPPDELRRARVDLLRGQIAFAANRGEAAPPLLARAATRLEPLDARLARETHLDALAAALYASRADGGDVLREVGQAARSAPSRSGEPTPADLLLDGLAVLATEGYIAATPVMKRAVRAFSIDGVPIREALRWGWLACNVATSLWDAEAVRQLASRHARLARDAGALLVLAPALGVRVGAHLHAGELGSAAALIEEAQALTAATGMHHAPYLPLALAVFQGREAESAELIERCLVDLAATGEGYGAAVVHWADAFLSVGVGRYEDPVRAATRACSYPAEYGPVQWALPELIEAGVRSGASGPAADALERLSPMARGSGTNWALGLEARSRALLSAGAEADGLYRTALDHLEATRVRVELARTHLLYGEWLRRERRRRDAREPLRTAHAMLSAMGIEAFAERARRELLATGETVRKRTTQALDDLTAQEAHIARLAAGGRTNPEIAAQLFISPRTVEWHLRNVFGKLDITSRRQLQDALPHRERTAQPA